jgi:RNA-directed DNA polymerase
MAKKDMTFTNETSQIIPPGEWATLNDKQMEFLWKSLDWKSIEARVSKLQSRIAKAQKEGRKNLVKKLQYLLEHSIYAKLLAVRKVTSNQGKKTPGVDGQLWKTPSSKLKAALSLNRRGYKASPLKRIYIEKKGKKKKRPLGIPTMYDRSMQALYLLTLDPIAETTADKVSFGFRKKRCTKDAASHIYLYLKNQNSAQWILEGDIKGCFDNISHQWLMDNIPMDKRILRKFLKAGFIYRKQLHPTTDGTPQGGIISPVLANMALDGIEELLKDKYWKNAKGIPTYQSNKHKVHYTRYADDFIVTADSKETLQEIQRLITEHLAQRGLSLSEEKTLITRIDKGFDFLGWHFRRYKKLFLIKPSKASLKSISEKVRETIKDYLPAKQENLIWKLNPIITGWSNYHRSISAKETFSRLDRIIFTALWTWAKRRHANKSLQWIKDQYWKSEGNRNWVFAIGKIKLKLAADTKIQRHSMIKFDANPYLDGDYYKAREKNARNEKSLNCRQVVTRTGE